MTKSQLINHIAESAEVPRKTAQRMLEALSDVSLSVARSGQGASRGRAEVIELSPKFRDARLSRIDPAFEACRCCNVEARDKACERLKIVLACEIKTSSWNNLGKQG